MAIRNCRIIGLEGAHGTGKSTLVNALTAYFKSCHVHVANLSEIARESPFVEDVIIHHFGQFDITSELHLFAAQIAEEQILARYHELLLCDRTIVNVLGYSRLLLKEYSDAFSQEMLNSIEMFCRTYAKQYDSIFYVSDFYDLSLTQDPFRPKDPDFQRQADESIRQACIDVGLQLIDLPQGLALNEKVEWIAQRCGLLLD